MKYLRRPRLFEKWNILLLISGALAFSLAPGRAQPASTPPAPATAATGSGMISGHVQNSLDGTALASVRITVKNSTLETLTDETGDYRLMSVPAGTVDVTAFYTGLLAQTESVTVTAGAAVTQNFSLSRTSQAAANKGPVKLKPYVVETNKEYNEQAIAINEQRFAPNIKTVVSTDEYGDIGEGNVGEFVKFLPGVAVAYNGGIFANGISLRAFPSQNTLITVDGWQPATGLGIGNPGISRVFDLNAFQVLSAISRVEVADTPTPDLPATALGGAINMVPKSAFEYPAPQYSYKLYATTDSRYTSGSHPTFVGEQTLPDIRFPGFSVDAVVPVSKKFGFTFGATYDPRFVIYDSDTATWDQVRNVMTNDTVATSSQQRLAGSWGGTADWKLSDDDTLSGSLTYAVTHVISPRTSFATALGANPTINGSTYTSNGFIGSVTESPSNNADRLDQTWFSTLNYRHIGRIWQIDASGFYSANTSKQYYGRKGKFYTGTATLSNLQLTYNDVDGGGRPQPTSITAVNAAGPVDIFNSNNYNLTTVTDAPRDIISMSDGAQANVQRIFDLGVPVKIRAGVYLNHEAHDNKNPTFTYTFNGPNGTLVGNYDFINQAESSIPLAYGFPTAKVLALNKIYSYYLANPSAFTLNPATAISTDVVQSMKLIEIIPATYVRGDVKLMDNRLSLTAGVRFEDTIDEGWGELFDPNAIYQHDSSGNLILNSAGKPIATTSDPVQIARLEYKERGQYAHVTYGGYYPSLNASYNITDSMIARFGYSRVIGRPDYSNIVPGTSISDPTAAIPLITIHNTALKPWTANGYDLSLEQYFSNNGMAQVEVYRRDISNFFGSISSPATAAALTNLQLDPNGYTNYSIVSTFNVGDARVTGAMLSYKQALTFLPVWASGVQIFANTTMNHLEGTSAANFAGFIPKVINWGVSLDRRRFLIRLNWDYQSTARMGLQAASATVPANDYAYTPPRTTLDASFEIRIVRYLSLYGTARNLLDAPADTVRYAPGTPAYSQDVLFTRPGAFLSAGVKGTF